jgi:hypothetical protein
MQQFAKENAKMEMASEMMDDTISGALDDDEMEEETGDLVSQVLDEIGIDIGASAANAPTRARAGMAKAKQEEQSVQEDEDELISRLANLKS